MVVAKWREGKAGFFNGADAQKVADEIGMIQRDESGNLKSQQIVDAARDNPNSELYKCFEWDDSIAAERYRRKQACDIMCHLVYVEQEVPKDRPEIRINYCTRVGEGFAETKKIVRNEDQYKSLLEKAWAELRSFKARYSMLEELREIMELIN